MSIMDSVCEGYFIITDSDLIFEVKGVVHPRGRFIAYLRYVPDEYGARTRTDGMRYSKIYDLGERENFLRENYPEYLWFDKNTNRLLQSVAYTHIKFILDPRDCLSQLRDKGVHLNELECNSVRLADRIADVSGIPLSSFGVTGSLLAGLSTEDSDIDLIVFGEEYCRAAYDALKTNIPELERYTGKALSRHVTFRWGSLGEQYTWLYQIEGTKVLQGIFHNHEFFIRLVKDPNEVKRRYEYSKHTYVGKRTIRCQIIDDSQGIFTPCEYDVSCQSNPGVRRIISYRGRFTEHVMKGMNVEARGRLESVQIEGADPFLQLVVGECKTDYLVPIE